MNHSDVIIQGHQVSIGYRHGHHTTLIHHHLNFQLRRGQLTCLLGSNGAGKSTLLRTLAAVQPALEGDITLMGRPLAAYSELERSRTVGVVFTDKTQAGGLTVAELVGLGRQPHTGFFGRLNRHDKALIEDAMQKTGIAHKRHSYMAELSDGERQKAMIAKALVQECPLILLDEPTAFLDIVSRLEIMHLLHHLAATEHKAILMSTHDVEQALVLSDRLWLLNKATGLECGTTEDLILCHRMDTLFPTDRNIQFDLMHGVFSPSVRGDHRIHLTASNQILLHWAQNALNRNNYLCLPTPQPGLMQINVLSPHNILLNQNEHLSSFEQLIERIKGME